MTDNWKEITNTKELFSLNREEWEIQCSVAKDVWTKWTGEEWNIKYFFRARPRQPKMKKMKLLAYIHKGVGELCWMTNEQTSSSWVRVTSEDKEIEVPDDN